MAVDRLEIEVIDRQCSYGIVSGIRYLLSYLNTITIRAGFTPMRNHIKIASNFARVILNNVYESSDCLDTRRTITFLYQHWNRFVNKYIEFYETGRF